MTEARFEGMEKGEQQDLARRLADTSEVFNFQTALELVRLMPEEAERLMRMREENEKSQEESARGLERLHRAAQEFR